MCDAGFGFCISKREEAMAMANNIIEKESVLSMFMKKHVVKFVYPKPVFVNISRVQQKQPTVTTYGQEAKKECNSDDDFSSSPVISQHKYRPSNWTGRSIHFDGPSLTDSSVVTERMDLNSHTTSTYPDGLSKTSGKPVQITKEALCHPRALFGEFALSESFNDAVVRREQNCDDISRRAPSHSESAFDCLPAGQADYGPTGPVGFSTASGKNVNVSNKALYRAKAMFDDVSLSGSFCESGIGLKYSTNSAAGCNSAGGGVQTLFRNDLPSGFGNEFQAVHPKSARLPTIDFSTASGKAVQVSKGALCRANALFEDALTADFPGEAQIEPKCAQDFSDSVGFSTASGKKVSISEERLSRAKVLFEDASSDFLVEPQMQPKLVPSSTGPVGFSTASGKNVHISEERLTRAKAMFEEAPEEQLDQKCVSGFTGSVGFSTASGKKVRISEERLSTAKAIFEDSSSDLPVEPQMEAKRSSTDPVGFSLASGKNMRISDERLSRAKALFQDSPRSNSAIGETAKRGDIVTPKVPATRSKTLFTPLCGRKETSVSRSQVSASVKQLPFNAPKRTKDLPQAISIKKEDFGQTSDEEVNLRKRKIDDDDSFLNWQSSPTIGKKKRKPESNNSAEWSQSLTETLTQTSFYDADPTYVTDQVRNNRAQARMLQRRSIEHKKKLNPAIIAEAGLLFRKKSSRTCGANSWFQWIGKKVLPAAKRHEELIAEGVTISVCAVRSSNAGQFKFDGWDCFPFDVCKNNSHGFPLGEFLLILADDNTIGREQIEASFFASANVNPMLINSAWVGNHYRWIVWKLACMEQRFPDQFARQILTPRNVLEQLKYRYDREIDRCQRSALRRIIEHDDAAGKPMVLCVAAISESGTLELTDGWYGIQAHCDAALKRFIQVGKIFVGVKLIICGAELVSPGAASPLEIGVDTHLKVSANSIRRAGWASRLGFCSKGQPFTANLRSVIADGGAVSLVQVVVARVYPLVYMEKSADGKTNFRSERYYRKWTQSAESDYSEMLEKILEDVQREQEQKEKQTERVSNLTDEEKRCTIQQDAQKRMEKAMAIRGEFVAVLRLRLLDYTMPGFSAVLSLWRPGEDVTSMLKENQSYQLNNISVAAQRYGELQLNSLKQTRWRLIKDDMGTNAPVRTVTQLSSMSLRTFRPDFNELDTVGLVVHVGKLASKNSFQISVIFDGSTYLGIKCWSGFQEFALDGIIETGNLLAFSNLQWRPSSSTAKLPLAFISEATLVSCRPAAKHLELAMNNVKIAISDANACIIDAQQHVHTWMSSSTPSVITPSSTDMTALHRTPNQPTGGGKETPTLGSAKQAISRARLLDKYGTPPTLPALNVTPTHNVRQRFKPPALAASSKNN